VASKASQVVRKDEFAPESQVSGLNDPKKEITHPYDFLVVNAEFLTL